MGNAIKHAVLMGGNDGNYNFVGQADQGLSLFADFFLVYAEFVWAVCTGDGSVSILNFQNIFVGISLILCGDFVGGIFVQGKGFGGRSIYCDFHCGTGLLEKEAVTEKKKQCQSKDCCEKNDVSTTQFRNAGNGGMLLVGGDAGLVHMAFLSYYR